MARDPNRDFGPASNPWESPDWVHAWNDNRAAQDEVDPWERHDFREDDWRTEDSEPTAPPWARDDGWERDRWEPEPERRSGWFRGGWGW